LQTETTELNSSAPPGVANDAFRLPWRKGTLTALNVPALVLGSSVVPQANSPSVSPPAVAVAVNGNSVPAVAELQAPVAVGRDAVSLITIEAGMDGVIVLLIGSF
jgi:hypothetical protein